jgi:uncharacterized damage-inducible protein DinB
MKDKWRHLFVDGEYALREKILSGLTLEQVTHRPSEQSHSIYEELWHTTKWQHIVVFRDEEEDKSWANGDLYPKNLPVSESDWHDLVREFLSGLEKALEWTVAPEKLEMESDPGITMDDNLVSLAVHNAYHLGKIVALRQMIGVWQPEKNQSQA